VTEPAVLASTDRRLTALLATEQVNARAPSLVAGVVRDGGLVWSGARGTAVGPEPLAGDEPATVDTQYRIGSITKVMTAVLVLQLRDEGALRLTDPLGDHLSGVPYGDRSLRELLSHSSGMPAEPAGPWWERSPGRGFDDLVAGLDPAMAPFAPGARHHYSNVGYALLGQLVAVTRGASWWSVLQGRLLTPLGMHRTSYAPEGPAATGFSVDEFRGTLTVEPSHDSGAMAPAGQLWSTVEDLARLAAFLADPDPSVLSSDSLTEMTTAQTGTPDRVHEGSYGLGLRLAGVADRSYAGHTGSVPGFAAGLFVDRERHTGAVCLTNGFGGLRAQGFPIEMLQTLEAAEPSLPPAWQPVTDVPREIGEILGVWFWGNVAVSMSYDGQQVIVRLLGQGVPWCTFRLVAPGRLVGATGYFAGEPLHAVPRPGLGVGHLECATFIFTRRPYDPEAPIPGGTSPSGAA
jgi:D-alanyl-D-alanine carboxypeptidase